MTRSIVVALFALIMPLLAHADAAEPFKEGQQYYRIAEPVRPRNPQKIEVVEVFWYGCPHCYRFDPLIKTWQKTLPADVDFYRMPVIWNSTTQLHAQAFYTAQALGVLDKMHDPLFEALNVQGNPLNNRDKIEQLFVQHGVSADQFKKAFDSFGVTSQVNQAKARTLGYKVEGTPEIIVAGKYRIDGRSLGDTERASHEKMLEVANFLIEKERQAAKK
jgi:thiol:disulfide interchange protein DsbA